MRSSAYRDDLRLGGVRGNSCRGSGQRDSADDRRLAVCRQDADFGDRRVVEQPDHVHLQVDPLQQPDSDSLQRDRRSDRHDLHVDAGGRGALDRRLRLGEQLGRHGRTSELEDDRSDLRSERTCVQGAADHFRNAAGR